MLRGIKSTRVVSPDGVGPATVVVRGERIEEVLRGDSGLPASALEDVGQQVVTAGLVDCHVHINEPGRTEWEGFASATRAAAAGGVTTLVDMPLNSLPVTTDASALAQKLEASEHQRYVDVGFWGGVVPGNALHLSELAKAGVLGCKAFMVHSGIDEFPNSTRADLARAMPILRDAGLPLLAHAELDLGAHVTEPDPRVYRGYLQSRPNAWEDQAIELLVELCRETRCAVHIVHLSSASSLETLRRAKDEGLPISAETCPHYLCLEAESIPDGATEFKCAPPIREHDNREALWRGLFEGVIDFVVTDHSPCSPALKRQDLGDFAQAWGGIASLSLGLSTLWTEGLRRGATLVQLSHWLSERPARFAGLKGTKGKLQRGYDADIVIWDPEASFEVAPNDLYFRHKLTPYFARTLQGRVHSTMLRGQRVFDGTHHPAGPVGRTLLHRTAP
ncbi:MAG: allantoinase [Myxococcaceae bacterium]|nr:allantoinase [Myxococcaceae bacterium]